MGRRSRRRRYAPTTPEEMAALEREFAHTVDDDDVFWIAGEPLPVNPDDPYLNPDPYLCGLPISAQLTLAL